jgi:hypothetical protein
MTRGHFAPAPGTGRREARRIRSAIVGTLALLLILVTGEDAAWAGTGPATATNGGRTCAPVTGFHRGEFSHPTMIDNKFFPLIPGRRFIYEGRANRGGGVLPHRIIFTVTDMTKVINGVRTRVVWDRDFNEGQLAEAELAFFAQDNYGNVWSMGEYPEEYENGKFGGAPSVWIPGVARARAGVMMRARPRVGTARYLQGAAPGIDFLDCAKVFKTGQRTCVPHRCYKNVLVTDENSPLDPDGGHQRKEYAPGVGNIRISAVGDPEGETLVLVDVVHLGPKGLAQARAGVRKLEKRAFRISRVYRHTSPAR